MKLVLDPGIDRLLAGYGGVQTACRVRGERVVEIAKELAPVDTGAYRDSIHLEHHPFHVEIVADVPYAGFIEFGSSHIEARHVLLNAVEAAAHEG